MDDRSLEWTQLLPEPARFDVFGGPQWLRETLEERSTVNGASPIAVLWEPQSDIEVDLDAYQAVVALKPSKIRVPDLKASGFTQILRYAAFPSLNDARWFIPLESSRITVAAFGMYMPIKPRAALKQSAVQLMMRTGSHAWYRDDVWVALRAVSPLHMAASSMVNIPRVHLGISTGNPGPSRKPSLAVLDDAGNIQAILRVATNDLQRKLVANEAAILRGISGLSGISGEVPRLLGEVELGTRLATAQSLVSGGNPPVELTEVHRRFLRELQNGSKKRGTETALVRNLAQRAERMPTSAQALARLALTIIHSSLENVMLLATVNHGDFAPWNLRSSGDSLYAFDWEYGVMDGLPLVDEIHHRLQVETLVRKSSVSQSLAMLSDASIWTHQELSPESIAAIQMTHLLHRSLHWWEYNNGDVLKIPHFELLEHLVRRWGERAA